MPRGFRAPSHVIDPKEINLLQNKGFLYDSSVVPRFPFLVKYRGFKKRAPITPYSPARDNCRKKGNMEILEIPVSGLIFGVPLWGGVMRYIPFTSYKDMLNVKSPAFINLTMHSWDAVALKGRKSKNSGARFLKILDKMIVLLKSKNYKFMDGESIARAYKKI